MRNRDIVLVGVVLVLAWWYYHTRSTKLVVPNVVAKTVWFTKLGNRGSVNLNNPASNDNTDPHTPILDQSGQRIFRLY